MLKPNEYGEWVCSLDRDRLAGVSCPDGGIPRYSEALHAFECPAEADLSVAFAVEADRLQNEPAACPAGQFVRDLGADGVLTCSNPVVTDEWSELRYNPASGYLSIKPCTDWQMLKYTSEWGWVCVWDNDALGNLSCGNGDVAKADGSGGWSCEGDLQGLYSDPVACPAGQFVTDQNANGVLTCAGPTAWTAPSDYSNAWTAGTTAPAYRKLADGRVEMRGSVKSGSLSYAAFGLPTGYKPTVARNFSVATNSLTSPTATCVVNVSTSGAVYPMSGCNNVAVWLDGVTFATN